MLLVSLRITRTDRHDIFQIICLCLPVRSKRSGNDTGICNSLRISVGILVRHRGRCRGAFNRFDIDSVQPVVVVGAVTGKQVIAGLACKIAEHLLIHRRDDTLYGSTAAGVRYLRRRTGHQDPADRIGTPVIEHIISWPLRRDVRTVWRFNRVIVIGIITDRLRTRCKCCSGNMILAVIPVTAEVG